MSENTTTSPAAGASRLHRPPRWLIVTLVVLVLLPVAGMVAAKAMFPPERLREIAEPQLERRIARDVELGDVSLKVFPTIAIRLTDVRIGNPPEGFSDQPAVRMDALDLRLELLPLLFRRQFRLSQVRLVAPLVRYEVAADGSNNLTGLLASDSAAAPEPADASAGSNFDIEDLVVVEGALAYVNSESRRAGRAGFAGRLDVLPPEREGGPLASSGGFRLFDALMIADGRDTTRLPAVEVSYRAVFEGDGARVAVPELTVRTAGLQLEGEAASRAEGESRTVRLELSSNEFEIADLLAELPEPLVADTLDLDGRASFDLRYAGELGGDPGPALSGSGTYSNASLATPGRGRVADAVGGTFSFTTESVQAPDASGRLFGRPFEARVRVDGLTDPSPRVDGHLSGEFGLAQLNDFREGEPLEIEGSASVAVDFAGPANAVDRWNLTGPVRLSNVVWTSESLAQPAEIASATVQFTGAGVRGDAIPVRVGGSDLAVTFSSGQLVRHFLTDESERGQAPLIEFTARSGRLAAEDFRRGPTELGYSDLLKARLAGRDIDGRAPEAIARERYHRPELSEYRASGTVSIAEWVNPPTNASDVSFRVDLANGLVEATQIGGTVYGGRLSGGASIDLAAEAPYEVVYELQLQGAGAGSLLERWTRLGRALSGTLDFDISGAASLDEAFLPIPAGLTAAGRTSFVEGRFEELGLVRALRSHLNLGEENLRGFRDLGGPFEIRDGQFLVRNWTFAAGDIQGAVSGAAGLAGLLDLDLAFLLPPEMLRNTPIASANSTIEGLLAQIGGEDGAPADESVAPVPLRLTIGGTMQSPALSVDTEALTSSLRGRITETGRGRVEREVGDRLEDAAGGLLDRFRPGRRDTVTATDSVPADTTQP
ncbi:MAG TPA: AsmA-like C-terminal region-containing protein [Gemmatimonadota bacterium]|nr:AsmA-like C-terminal region-containing protein [Gemmatimonadota bacterium]